MYFCFRLIGRSLIFPLEFDNHNNNNTNNKYLHCPEKDGSVSARPATPHREMAAKDEKGEKLYLYRNSFSNNIKYYRYTT